MTFQWKLRPVRPFNTPTIQEVSTIHSLLSWQTKPLWYSTHKICHRKKAVCSWQFSLANLDPVSFSVSSKQWKFSSKHKDSYSLKTSWILWHLLIRFLGPRKTFPDKRPSGEAVKPKTAVRVLLQSYHRWVIIFVMNFTLTPPARVNFLLQCICSIFYSHISKKSLELFAKSIHPWTWYKYINLQ